MKMVFLLFLLTVSSVFFMPQILADTSVPAIFVFGDSTADVGNNNFLAGDNKAKANYPHNGIDYPGATPTGRFSNGYNGVDFLAKLMGFEQSPPSVLSMKNEERSMLQGGASFASGGSGILDATGQNYSLSMSTQILYFEEFTKLNKFTPQMGELAANSIISNSLFFFSTGNNDMFAFYATQNSNQSEQFITLLSSQFKDQLKRLYELGARKFAVLGMSHIGCVPFLRSRNPSGGCIEELNDWALQFNNATKANLDELSATMEGMKYSFINSYQMTSSVKEDPIQYGFKDIESACCGAGNFNGASGCTPDATYCSNRDEYFFWDWFHPTQANYKLVAEESYNDGSQKFATPINIKDLAMI